MTLRASSYATGTANAIPPLMEGARSGDSPLTAELLIVAMDPDEAKTTLGSMFEENGIVFNPTFDGEGQILARVTTVMQSLATTRLPLPAELQKCSALLCSELQTMQRLKLVLTLGVSAHIVVLGACGVPLSRLDFRPGEITTLPDGLLLADACHFPSQPIPSDIRLQRRATLAALVPKIRDALRSKF